MGDATTGLLCNLHLDGRIGRDNVNLPLRELTGYDAVRGRRQLLLGGLRRARGPGGGRAVVNKVIAGGDPASSRAAG